MKKTKFKKIAALLLSMCMLASLLPINGITVFAADGSVSASIYLDDGDGMYMDEEKVDTFAVDQQGLILDLRDFSPIVEAGWGVESLAFYPTDGSSPWGTVFWYNGEGDYFCDNGTPLDKLENGVFQLENFTPNGNMELTPGEYKILVYVGNGDSENYQETLYYSTEVFTIGDSGTPPSGGGVQTGNPFISTSSLPDATYKQEYTYVMSAIPGTSGNTLTWSADGLPAGLAIDASTGIITGAPTADGSFNVKFTVTENDKQASKTLRLNVIREQSSIQWETAEVSLSNYIKNVQSDYTFTLKPTEAFTPAAGTELKITGFDTDFTNSAFTGLPGGITATGTKDALTLTFDGTAAVSADGFTFTAQGAVNGELNCVPYIDRMNYEDAEIGWKYFLTIFFVDEAQYKLRIENYNDPKLNGVTFSATMYDDSDGSQVSTQKTVDKNGAVTFSINEDMNGKNYTIKIGSASNVYASHTFTADAYAEKEGSIAIDFDDFDIITVVPNIETRYMSLCYIDKNTGKYIYDPWPDVGSDSQYLVDKNELQTIINEDRLVFYCGFKLSSDIYEYSTDHDPTYTLDGNTLYVNFPEYGRTGKVFGYVMDENGNPIAGARVAVSPRYSFSSAWHKISENFYTVTNESGYYEVGQLRNELSYKASTTVDGYKTKTVSSTDGYNGIGDTPCRLDIQLVKSGIIEVVVNGGDLLRAKFQVFGPDGKGKIIEADTYSGSIFHIRSYEDSDYIGLPDGKYTVKIGSYNIENVETTVEIVNGFGRVEIDPKRHVELIFPYDDSDLYAYARCDDDGTYTYLFEYNYLPAGNYTLFVTRNRYMVYNNGSTFGDASLSFSDLEKEIAEGTAKESKFVLRDGESFVVDSSMLPPRNSYVKGTVEAPTSAKTGEIYKISGVIENPDIRYILFSPMDAGAVDMFGAIKQITINGKNAIWTAGEENTIHEGMATVDKYAKDHVSGTSNEDIWTFPMHYTVYVEQCATSASPVQGYSVITTLETTSGGFPIGSAMTSWNPGISITTVNTVGKSIDGQTPDSFYFTGKTSPYALISILDNGTLVAQIESDYYGCFEGRAQLVSDGTRNHTITAQYVDNNGTVIQGTDTLVYDPNGPVLTDILYDNERLQIDGSTYSYGVPDWGTSIIYRTATAYFKNAELLGDMTATVDGEEVTGKVFFRMGNGSSYKIYKAEQQSNGSWSCQVPDSFTSIKVLYKAADPETNVNIEGTEMAFDGSYTSDFHDSSKLFDWDNLFGQIQGNTSQSEVQLMQDAAAEETDGITALANSEESEEMYQAIVDALGGDFSTLTAQTAAEDASAYHEYRTYIDEPSWSQSSLTYKIQELQGKGYKGYCYTDADGKQYLMFTGDFYYDKQGMPVPSLYKQVTDGGIRKVIEDERMFAGGQMIGSSLNVNYICDVKTGKWYRTQAALVPAGARSPIHTVSTQIPCAVDAPYSYTPASQASLFDASAALFENNAPITLADTRAGGGICGIRFKIDPSKVSAKTYTDGAMMIIMFGAGKLIKSQTWLVKASDDIEWKSLTYLKDGKLSSTLTEYGSKLEIGLKKDDLIMGGVGFGIGQLTGLAIKGQDTASLPDTFSNLRNRLTKNLRWWGSTGSDAEHTSEYMKYRTSKLLNSLTELEDELMRAQTQNQFTQDTTGGMMFLSLAASFAPGVGTASGLTLDSLALLLNAANDTRNAETVEKVNKFIAEYEDYFVTDQDSKETWKVLTDKDYDPNDDPLYDGFEEKPDSRVNRVYDPSGFAYEAVLSNPVEGAKMTLYYADYNDSGEYIQEGETEKYDSAVMKQHDDYFYLKQDNPIYTDSQGYYRWDVPTGLWYVTADADGYLTGNSNADKAATVTANGINWLPVLPPQLEVNIPLVNNDPPEVEEMTVAPDGVYIRFSKYLDETKLVKENFALSDSNNNNTPIDFTLELLDSEQAPDNIDYGDGVEAPYYTRTVLLKADLALSSEVTVGISSNIQSYAGTSMEQKYEEIGTVAAKQTVAAPTANPESGKVKKNSAVTLTTETDGARIYYTRDGSTPTESSTLYTNPIMIVDDVTIKAVAVKYGMENSEVAEFEYQLDASDTEHPDLPGSGNEDNPTHVGGGGGGGGTSSYTVKFDTLGGSEIDSVKVNSGGKLTKPADPTREGYTFEGWFTDKECTTAYDFDTKVTKSFTLYAKWTEKEIIPIEWKNPFTDVKESDWFYENVRYVYENKLFAGVSDTEFAPNTEMTRAMLVTVLYRAEGEPAITRNIPFADIDMNEYYANAVIWAAANGIVNGYDENTFAPNDNITREQIAAIMERYADFKGADTTQTGDLSQFTDEADISDWARDNVSWAVGAGLISGKGDGILDPLGNATRAEVAAILQRFLKK